MPEATVNGTASIPSGEGFPRFRSMSYMSEQLNRALTGDPHGDLHSPIMHQIPH